MFEENFRVARYGDNCAEAVRHATTRTIVTFPTTMSHLIQMLGVTVYNILSAATGLANGLRAGARPHSLLPANYG